jgi:hypothetical protein
VILAIYGEAQVSSELAVKLTKLSKKAALKAVSLGVILLSQRCYCGWFLIARIWVDYGFYFFDAIRWKATFFSVLPDNLFLLIN